MRRRTPQPRHSIMKLLIPLSLVIIAIAVLVKFLTEGNKIKIVNEKNDYKPIRNPYGNPRLCGEARVAPINNAAACHEIQTHSSYDNGKLIVRKHCVRKMKQPAAECFDRAIADGVVALSSWDYEKFREIMQMWPVEQRKPLHDRVVQMLRDKGIDAGTKMQEFKPSDNATDYEKLLQQPHHNTYL